MSQSIRGKLPLLIMLLSSWTLLISLPLLGQEAKVSVDSLEVYDDMSANGAAVRTLRKGDLVYVTMSIQGSGGELCKLNESAQGTSIGWVRCSGLERQPLRMGVSSSSASSLPSTASGGTIGPITAANIITTVVGASPPQTNAKLRALEEKLLEDMQRGYVSPNDLLLLQQYREKAFREAGGRPEDIRTLIDAAFQDLRTGGNLSQVKLAEVVAKMLARKQLQPVGDGGPALLAELNMPKGLAFDQAGNLYIADSGNHRIRKVAPNGIITTVAGIGLRGYSSDGELATEAQLMNPRDVAVDASGNIYIADQYANCVRMVTADGKIWTLAGDGVAGFSGDGGPAYQARLRNPQAVELDRAGNLYIADSGNYRIRKIDRSRIITTVAGIGKPGYSGDGGSATSAHLSASDLTFDRDGNLYIADMGNKRIRRISSEGVITTVAGGGDNYPPGGGQAVAAQLRRPTGVAVDGGGNLYIADSFAFCIYRVNHKGMIELLAGGRQSFSGDGGSAQQAGLISPERIVVDSAGNLFISTADRIRKVSSVAVGTH